MKQSHFSGFIKRAATYVLNPLQSKELYKQAFGLDELGEFIGNHKAELGGAAAGAGIGALAAGKDHRLLGALGGGALGGGAGYTLANSPSVKDWLLHNRNAENAENGTDPIQENVPSAAEQVGQRYADYDVSGIKDVPVQDPAFSQAVKNMGANKWPSGADMHSGAWNQTNAGNLSAPPSGDPAFSKAVANMGASKWPSGADMHNGAWLQPAAPNPNVSPLGNPAFSKAVKSMGAHRWPNGSPMHDGAWNQ